MKLNQPLSGSDALLVFGNHDILVARRGVELYFNGLAPIIIFTGGLGRVTSDTWQKTEAETFADIAISLGVPEANIYIENKSSNTGENIEFTKKLIHDKMLNISRVIAIHQPYMERRIFAAIKNYWPEIDVIVTSPELDFAAYCQELAKEGYSQDKVINVLVGDFQRIDIYAKKGFQIPQEIPQKVWKAFYQLVDMGYTKYIIN